VRRTLRLVVVPLCVTGAALAAAERPQLEERAGSAALRTAVLVAQDARVDTAAHRAVIAQALASETPDDRVLALRAIARTQPSEALDAAVDALAHPSIDVRREAAFAVAQIASGSEAALARGEAALRAAIGRERDALVFGALLEEYGRLPFVDHTSLDAGARLIRDAFVTRATSPDLPAIVRLSTARAAEAMARRSVRLKALVPALDELLSMLSERPEPAGSALRPDPVATRTLRLAFAGLLALPTTADAALARAQQSPDAQTRRLGVLALARRDHVNRDALRTLLRDEAMIVRHAVVARLGTKMPEVARAALDDPHVHVRLAALQALGEARHCRNECVTRISAWTRNGTWHEGAAALVSLARTAPAEAAAHVVRAAAAQTWQVRLYAARAAAFTKQADVLASLSRDPHVNVQHAALVAWREAALPGLASAARRALESDDGQLVLEAATALKGATPSRPLVRSLRAALVRLTAQGRETSRDPRIALLDRIDELDPQRADTLRPYLADFDAAVAARAQTLLTAWAGLAVVARPRPVSRAAVPTWDAVVRLEATSVVLTFANNRTLTLRLYPRHAPTAVARFVSQVQAGEWNGRTFHRVEPGFVIQGGSPAANEYAGAAAFTRDEFSALSHVRGTVGISTRGPDTGDGQIFVNLVDNVRLDYGFTVIGAVTSDPSVLDDVVEGEVIVSAVVRTRQQP